MTDNGLVAIAIIMVLVLGVVDRVVFYYVIKVYNQPKPPTSVVLPTPSAEQVTREIPGQGWSSPTTAE